MKKLTREIIEEHYSLINETSELKEIFQKVLVYFLDFHHFKNKAKENDTLFCGIHNNFSKEHHNCVACNLNDYINKKCTVTLLGGNLFIEWNEKDNHIYMTGPATTVFEGILE